MFATGADGAREMPAVAVGNVFDDPVLMALNDVEREAGPPSVPHVIPQVGVPSGLYDDSFEPGKFFGNIHAQAYPIFNYTGSL